MASTLLSPMVEYYNDEEELDSVDDDDDRSFRGRDSEEGRETRTESSGSVYLEAGRQKDRRGDKRGNKAMTALPDTEDASETDLAKHDEDDYVEIKEQMYQDKLASLKRQLQQLQEGTLQEYQKRMKKLDQQYKERLRNAGKLSNIWGQNTLTTSPPSSMFSISLVHLQTEQVERNYIKEKKAAVKEFDDKKVELKENLIAELEEKKKMIENEKLTMELTGVSPSSPEHVPSAPMENLSQRYEARIEEGKLYYDKRWYHKSQAIYLESKDNTKISCVISSVGTNEVSFLSHPAFWRNKQQRLIEWWNGKSY
ncbi:hypothetical protein L3Q82_023052, partial [Scortum barcoo]